MGGATKNNTGGTFENLRGSENSNMGGHTKFLGGSEKMERARLSGSLLQMGVYSM